MPESERITILRRVKASFGDNPGAKSKLVKLLAAPSCNAAIIETLVLFVDVEDEEDFKVAALAIVADNEEGNDNDARDMVNEAKTETPLLSWQQDVVKILQTRAFKDDNETFLRVRWFLHNADLESRENPFEAHSPYWKSLRSSMNNPVHFTAFAKRLADDTKTAEMDPRFKKAMEDAYKGMMQENSSCSQLALYQGGSFQNAVVSSKNCLQSVVSSRCALLSVEEMVAVLGPNANAIVGVALAGGYLAYKALSAIHRWWTGEISGARCAQICINETTTMAAGALGSIGGAALGGAVMGGPGAAAVGSLMGGITCLMSASYLSDWMTQKLFNLPKEEALENAYRTIGISPDSSNSKVNQVFYKLCLKHHPDKGGDKDEFIKVQTAMEVIRASREEKNFAGL